MNSNVSVASRYTTLAEDLAHEVEIKRSRFITYLYRVNSESAAREKIAALRKSHFDARHHCSAFVLGADRMVQRSSDDGEPSGTAGIPMLEALTKRATEHGTDLSDIVAVCVRYFGGIKLGAGGLVRAYSDSVSQALDAATLLTRQRMLLLQVVASHAEAPRYENELRASGYHVGATEWLAEHAVLEVAVDDVPGAEADFAQYLATLSSGTAQATKSGHEWVDLR